MLMFQDSTELVGAINSYREAGKSQFVLLIKQVTEADVAVGLGAVIGGLAGAFFSSK